MPQSFPLASETQQEEARFGVERPVHKGLLSPSLSRRRTTQVTQGTCLICVAWFPLGWKEDASKEEGRAGAAVLDEAPKSFGDTWPAWTCQLA